jgi:ABC-type transporter Mla subunit MlaD
MADSELLHERIDTLERTLTGSTADDLSERVAALETQVAELEAAVQALRGYVGNVNHVNSEVERRVDAALAAVESEREVAELRAADGSRIESTQTTEQSTVSDCSEDVPVDPTLLARIRKAL